MKCLVLLCALGFASASHLAGTITSQYHAQDELGQYSYGYSGGPSSKHETRTADGITQGGYSYIDGHGLVQSAAYVSDPHNGFRVAATNLPVGPAVPAGHVGAVAAAPAVVAAAPAAIAAPAVVAARVAAPAVVAAAPAVVATPAISTHAISTHAISPLGLSALPGAIYGTHGWSGLVHSLKKRSLGWTALTSFPGSTGPLLHGAPIVTAHAAPIVTAHAAPIVAAHAAPIVATHAALPFGGPHHPLDTHSVAAARAAHLSTKAVETVRNLAGAPLPHVIDAQDTHSVAAAKVSHAAAQLEARTRLHHIWKRSPVWSHGLAVAPLAYGLPFGGPHHPIDTPAVAHARAAHLATSAVEHARNSWGAVLPHVIDAQDTHAVAAAKVSHAAAQLEARTRLHHIWKRAAIWPHSLITAHAAPAVVAAPALVAAPAVVATPAVVGHSTVVAHHAPLVASHLW